MIFNTTGICTKTLFQLFEYDADILDVRFDLPTAKFLGFNNSFEPVNVGFTFPIPTKLGDNFLYIYGKPPKMSNFANVTSVFGYDVWGLIGLSCLAFILTSLMFHHVYSKKLDNSEFMKKKVSKVDISLKIFSSLTEPADMEFFSRATTGSVMYLPIESFLSKLFFN